MVDQTNPTAQFHPYQPQDAVPHSMEPAKTGLDGVLEKIGVDSSKVRELTGNVRDKVNGLDVSGAVSKGRDWARANPAIILGGLAAAVIGLGLVRKYSTSSNS